MHSMRLQRFSRRHLPWLLWLALLLPLAQTAANWHVLSHTQPNALEEGNGGKAIHAAQCELCLSAAAVIGGAPLAESPALPAPPAPHVAPRIEPSDGVTAPSSPVYESRAPPLLPN